MDNNKGKKPREDVRRENAQFLVKLLASIDAAVQTREQAGTFGELTVKIAQNKGVITGAKIVEETVIKPSDV